MIATQKGHQEIVKFLCENGAKIEASQKDQWTPLHQGRITCTQMN